MGFIEGLFVVVISPFIWALASKVFPEFVGKMITLPLEHTYAIQLEGVRAELATLKTSAEFVSATQREFRVKTISSSKRLWNLLVKLADDLGAAVILDQLFTHDELTCSFDSQEDEQSKKMLAVVSGFADWNRVSKTLGSFKADAADEDRIFVSSRLWLLFYVQRAIYGRATVLIQQSFAKRQFQDWRKDALFSDNLKNVVPDDVVDRAKSGRGGLQLLVSYVEGEFVKEAQMMMSGTRSLRDTLSDVQESLIGEKEKIASRALSVSP